MEIRQGNNHNRRAFGNWLSGINWSNLFRTNSCDHKLNIFYTVIKTGWTVPPPPPAKLLSYTIIINPGLPQTPRKLLKRGRERSEKVRDHNYVDYKIQRIEKVRGSNQPISRERWRSYNYILMQKSGGNALNN